MLQQIDHTEYPKRLKRKKIAELMFIIHDAQAAIEAYPENPKCSYYQDEINYCAMELRNRKQKAEMMHNRNSTNHTKAELSIMASALNMISKTYKATEVNTNHEIIVPYAINEHDATEQVRSIYMDLTHGRTNGVWKVEEVKEPVVVSKPGYVS